MVQQSPAEGFGWTMAELQLAMSMTIRMRMVELDKLVDIHLMTTFVYSTFNIMVISWPIHDSACQSFHSKYIRICFMQLSKQSCPSNTWNQLHVQESHKIQPSNKAS